MDRTEKAYRLNLYEKAMPKTLSWKEKLLITRESGFDGLEISIDETDEKLARLDWDEKTIRDLKRDMEETGVSIPTMCLSGHRRFPLGSREGQERSLEIMEKALRLACALGIRLIQLAGYDVYYETGTEETRERFARNLRKAVDMAAKYGVALGFETMETPFMDTVGKAMEYVSLTESAWLGVYPDLGNLKNASLLYGVPVVEDLKTGKGHIFAAHLKETVPGKYREIPFGTGHTEYASGIEELKKQGVRMFTGEFWYTGSENWKEDIRKASDFLRGYLDAAFGPRK